MIGASRDDRVRLQTIVNGYCLIESIGRVGNTQKTCRSDPVALHTSRSKGPPEAGLLFRKTDCIETPDSLFNAGTFAVNLFLQSGIVLGYPHGETATLVTYTAVTWVDIGSNRNLLPSFRRHNSFVLIRTQACLVALIRTHSRLFMTIRTHECSFGTCRTKRRRRRKLTNICSPSRKPRNFSTSRYKRCAAGERNEPARDQSASDASGNTNRLMYRRSSTAA